MGKDAILKFCKDAVVKLDKWVAIVLFIVNIVFPSIGTMISACCGKKFHKEALIVGLCQFLTCFVFVGWVWSIVHGVWLVKEANK